MSTIELPAFASSFANASNLMLAAILDQSMDCIKVVSAEGTVEFMNRNGQCAMEIDDFCVIAGQRWTELWPEGSRAKIEDAMASAMAGHASQFEAFCPTAKGSPRWWDVSLSPLRRPDGTVDGLIATSRDVTERHNQSALRDAVAEEMRHRLRNSYVVVSSLLLAYARGNAEQEAFAQDMFDRLATLSIAQTMKADDRSEVKISELVPSLLDPYATPDCPIVITSLPEAGLDQAGVDAIALVMGELACNSTKHGALSTVGTIDVTGRRTDDLLELHWSERSARAVDHHGRDGGQGLRLMERVLTSQGGKIDLSWMPHGLEVVVTIRVIS